MLLLLLVVELYLVQKVIGIYVDLVLVKMLEQKDFTEQMVMLSQIVLSCPLDLNLDMELETPLALG